MDACRKGHPSETVVGLWGRGEDKFVLSGEIMTWELICHLELLKVVLLVGWKLSSGAPFFGGKLLQWEHVMSSCLSGTWPVTNICFTYLISFNSPNNLSRQALLSPLKK